ncbi:MAG TPA: hypothetical protein VKJ01_26400, partial [Candidatus Solibacter sp.]|nr:hypothetical protein [Candidatus Solibacter sp.]
RPLRPNPPRILARLIQGEDSVNELAEPFDMSLPAISRRLNPSLTLRTPFSVMTLEIPCK